MPTHVRLDDLPESRRATVCEDPTTVRLRLATDEHVPAHSHPGSAVVCVLHEGRLDVDLDGETYALASGEVLRFDGERRVALHAHEESVAVLVFAVTQTD